MHELSEAEIILLEYSRALREYRQANKRLSEARDEMMAYLDKNHWKLASIERGTYDPDDDLGI